MSLTFNRTDTSLLGRWWWTVDRWTLVSLLLLMGIGCVLIITASPSVANRIGMDTFGLVKRQLVWLPMALAVLFIASLATPRWVRRLSVVAMAGSILLLILTLIIGAEIKGATRWLSFGGLSVQPAEFAKPFFAVTLAWILATGKQEDFPGMMVATGLWLLVSSLLALQPDVGQTAIITGIFLVQLFLAGLPMFWVAGLAVMVISAFLGAYFTMPHVTERVNAFLDPEAGDRYQIGRSLEAFMNGGLWGQGPGEGTIKQYLPDAHADFIFAVAGEELGLFACLIIVSLFAFIVLRGFARLLHEESLFVLLAATGLLVQFGFQALINMGSTLHLMPTKGMTLPFISYGGSSLVALALGMGMLLALTRRRAGAESEEP
ncbi:MAG: putative lipid II flippase FtsW [Pseudomonadota bacterium]|uniref:putative lipid II flippase FtsW n=1 Tax=Fodinicurvata fenggangensis TaxID=1121830 RepID=UPI00047A9F63|nr:putative lipid II flippase FtsW [Fodinicurvata fenggangensis]